MLTLSVFLSTRFLPPGDRAGDRSRAEAGQASVEYALVLLGAGIVATLVIAWAQKTQLLDDLFDHVVNLVKGKAK